MAEEIVTRDSAASIQRERSSQARELTDEWTNKCNISNFAALINLLKAAIAVGFFEMPKHMSTCGVLISAILGPSLLLLSLLASHIIIRLQVKVAKDRGKSFMCYIDVIHLLMSEGPLWCQKFTKCIKNTVQISIIVYYMVICAVYVNFMSYKAIHLFGSRNIVRQIIEILLFIPLFGLVLVMKIKHITYISAAGNVLLITAVSLIIYLIFTDEDETKIENTITFEWEFVEISSLIGNYLLTIHNFGVVVIVHAHMKNQNDFLKPAGVLNQSYLIVSIFMMIAGIQSLFNLASVADHPDISDGPENMLRIVLRIIYSFITFLSIPINFQVCAEVFAHYYYCHLPENHLFILTDLTIRSFLLVTIVLLALFIPALVLFYSFYGMVIVSIVGLMLPAITELAYTCKNEKKFCVRLKTIMSDLVVILASIVLFCIGLYETIMTTPNAGNYGEAMKAI